MFLNISNNLQRFSIKIMTNYYYILTNNFGRLSPYGHYFVIVIIFSAVACSITKSRQAFAASTHVTVPHRYDGVWNVHTIASGSLCPSNREFRINVKNGEAFYPGREIVIKGGVTNAGRVVVDVVKGGLKAHIHGRLSGDGTGSGSWHSSSTHLIKCNGSWKAKRTH